ncbi:MAG: tetratricopeptide repeat protein [Nitrospinaceae bacterium]|nr:tetratricopeptide repeat protein [Nitrospinaceae bacterium]NIR54020.1 tetratricopeptide repeat protein [Nitrospinaceae bacterium]NIT81233.1 tetratricopeptide repeat protein [Nitrospinaceae bacterium]NIU43520.1 tetratricopeptide repeat protein [Nitrospinaceae bacterium]NIU95637.1 tetratricopeptide repeat protein [Nitrospinaceae bacterium]
MENIISVPPLSCLRGFRVWWLAGALLFLGACASTNPQEKKLQAQQHFDEAMKADSLNLQKEKVAHLKEAIRISPQEPMYWVALGNAYFKNMDLDRAEKSYLKALKADPEYQGTYRQIGRLYMQRSEWKKAIFYLGKALQKPNVIDPVQLMNWQAYSHYRLGELARAEKIWMRALDIHESSQIRLNLALAYKEAERYELARNALLKALELNPKLMPAHYALGEIYYHKNKYASAKRHFKEVIELEPMGEHAKFSQKYLDRMASKK